MTALRRIPVRIAGDWQPVAYVGHVEWHGTARADEPITGLVLGRDPHGIHWARFARTGGTDLAIRLSVRPDEADRDRHAVRVSLGVGGAGESQSSGVLWTNLRLTSTAPFMFSLNHHDTGALSWFADPWSDDRVRLGALFVAHSDTRSARNHLWHLRKGIDGPSVGLSAALSYGRAGLVAA